MLGNSEPLVSVIMPAYNAALFIRDAIASVINQDYTNWELIIINDGSTDKTEEVIFSISDERIKYYRQNNKGVAAARNKGLTMMQGDFLCFLDADDIFPSGSISSRIRIFKGNLDVCFVDGVVEVKDYALKNVKRIFKPNFTGSPLPELLKLSEACFMGNTWMIRRIKDFSYHFKEGVTHGEDLLFYIGLADQGLYNYTHHKVLIYRTGHTSAMSDLQGLEKGYINLYTEIKSRIRYSSTQLFHLKYKIIKIMFLSYLFDGRQPAKAINSVFNLLIKLK